MDVEMVIRFKYAKWNTRGLGKKEELDKILNENNIKVSVITESKKKLQGTKETEHQWRTEGGIFNLPPPPKLRRPSKIVPNSTRL